MKLEYTHLKLNEDVTSIAGYYRPQREIRLEYNGREVLYVIGEVVVEATCCGAGRWRYALVPGYIINWQNKKSESGLPVSEVEPISDEEAQGNIRRIVRTSEAVSQVAFW